MRARAGIPRAGDCNREFVGGLRLRFRPGFSIYWDKIRFLSISITAKIIVQRRGRWIFGLYFESSQSCRDIAACFRILVIRLAPISSSRCELGMMMDISPLDITSCLDPG